jgi:hypothetical protein
VQKSKEDDEVLHDATCASVSDDDKDSGSSDFDFTNPEFEMNAELGEPEFGKARMWNSLW